jgi:nucleoid DNA-binding protein
MGYVLRKVKNDQSPVYNRWFARVDRPGTLSTRGLAQHMIEHGLVGNRADVESMLSKLSECIPELVAQGYGVKLDGIGIFYPTIKNRKGGAASVTEFTISENVEGVRFRFRPDSTDLDDLTAKAFGKKVSFGNGYYQTESGKKAPKIPLAAAENPQP